MKVYAISFHSGGGSMSEAMDSQGAIGFWNSETDALAAARSAFKRISADDDYLKNECDVRVVEIECFDSADSALMDTFVQHIRTTYGTE